MSDNNFEAMLAAAGMGNKKEIPEDYRCGYTAVVGRPNVGKSTLINAIVGEKVSITSKKPQTTRDRVLGVATDDDAQIVFVDTPGFQSKHTSQLLKHMNRTVRTALADVEAVLFVIDAAGWKSDDELVLKLLDREAKNVILVLNKIDLVKDKERLLPLMAESMQKFPFAAIVPVSAEKGKMLDDLKGEIKKLLPVSPPFFDADLYTDKSPRFIAAETIREKAFRLLGDELPYGLAVMIERWNETDDGAEIIASLWVNRESHKPIVIGEKGAKLREISRLARADIAELLGKRVHLEVWVRVRRERRRPHSEVPRLRRLILFIWPQRLYPVLRNVHPWCACVPKRRLCFQPNRGGRQVSLPNCSLNGMAVSRLWCGAPNVSRVVFAASSCPLSRLW